jgi:hypothetical protein
MNLLKSSVVTCVILLGLASVPSSQGGYYQRQYYSGWGRHSSDGYYYRSYYYRPSPSYTSYHHHYVVYYPQQPSYLYYYNPYKKVYWGRSLTQPNGQAQYQLLAEKDRKANLKDIPESAFPKAGPMPAIPESPDGTKMVLPPADMPKA